MRSRFLGGAALAAAVLLLAAFGPWLAHEIASLPRGALTVRSGERAVTLEIGGMTCGGCARVVRSQIAAVHGVSAVDVRLAVEAGISLGWERWVGSAGDIVSIERFGASAPGPTVLANFGYTVDNVVARATALLTRVA